jgi:hypothetical protein
MTFTICRHVERDATNHAIVSGTSRHAKARQWCVSRDTVQRHAKRHVSPALIAMQAERERQGAMSLLDRVEALTTRTERILLAAETDGKVTTALAAVRELRSLLELLGRASGELDDRAQLTVNVLASPEWLSLRDVVLGRWRPTPTHGPPSRAACLSWRRGSREVLASQDLHLVPL